MTRSDLDRLVEQLPEYVQARMAQFDVPGLALAIVHRSRVVFSEGFGVRRLGAPGPVTDRTVFPIASTSKAFTSTAVGILVDEGKLDWDRPVRQYYPELELYDPVASQLLTLRDMACHRSGLPRHDVVWYQSPYSQEEMIRRLRYLEPSASFRAKWQYQNLMYMTIGHVISRACGQPWTQFIRERIFEPLDMAASGFSIPEAGAEGDYAFPHAHAEGQLTEYPFYRELEPSADGSIVTNVRDMSRWLMLNLNSGRHHGHQIVSQEQLRNLHTPHVVVPDEDGASAAPGIPFSTYGLAWSVDPYRGQRLIHHDGAIDGFGATVALLPDHELGMVILANSDNAWYANMAIRNAIVDAAAELGAMDWAAHMQQQYAKDEAMARAEQDHHLQNRVPNTQPSHPLEDYAGQYEHPGYGMIEVAAVSGRLAISHYAFTFEASHYHYDMFDAPPSAAIDPGKPVLVAFSMNEAGIIDQLRIRLEPDPHVHPIGFTRRTQCPR